MQVVLDSLQSIAAEKEGFQFGDPWRYSDASVVAVMPIVRSIDRERKYITLVEAGKGVVITEIGRVNSVKVKNETDWNVFVRAGEIIAGSTQERAFTMSQIIPAKTEKEVEVVCIHQTRGLSMGTGMKTDGYTPRPVVHSLYSAAGMSASNYQSTVWGSIRRYAVSAYTAAVPTDKVFFPTDDLAQALHRTHTHIGDLLSKVPYVEKQVGLMTVGMEGALALECYDLHQSWSAVREAAIKQQGEDLSKVLNDMDQVFQFRPERAKEAARLLLTLPYKVESVGKNGNWETFALRHKDFVGSATVLNDEVIHLQLVRTTK